MLHKSSSIDFAEKPTEITNESSSSVPDSDTSPERSALKTTMLADVAVSGSPKGSPLQSTSELNGNDPEELQKSRPATT